MKDTRTEYHKEWRKKNPKKYAMNQLNFWKKRVKELEQEERELFGSDKSSDDEDVQQLKKRHLGQGIYKNHNTKGNES